MHSLLHVASKSVMTSIPAGKQLTEVGKSSSGEYDTVPGPSYRSTKAYTEVRLHLLLVFIRSIRKTDYYSFTSREVFYFVLLRKFY
jgi:hypothetical protein